MKKSTKEFLTTGSAIISGAAVVFYLGFFLADYKVQIECKLEKMEMQRSFESEIRAKSEACEAIEFQRSSKELQKLSKILKQITDGQK